MHLEVGIKFKVVRMFIDVIRDYTYIMDEILSGRKMITLEREQFVNKKSFMRNFWDIQIKLNQTVYNLPNRSQKNQLKLELNFLFVSSNFNLDACKSFMLGALSMVD